MRLFLFFVLISEVLFAQNQLQAVILDSATKAPLEFVDVYNHYNYTSTNADGSFLFTSEGDSVFIKHLGYKPLRTTFNKLYNKENIFLVEETIVLDAVVLTKKNDVYSRIVKSIESNYPFFPYEERFTLRAFLKKNDSVLKLQDLTGKLKRKQLFATKEHSMPRRNYEVELSNMRKAGIKEEDIEFMLGDFTKILDWCILHAPLKKDKYDVKSGVINDTVSIVEFTVKDSIVKATNSNNSGYLKINTENNAILENYLVLERDSVDYEKSGPYRYRTNFMKINAFFEQATNKKYFLKNAKVEAVLEVINIETSKKDIYSCSYILTTQDNFKELNIKKNASVKKDIFKLKYPYNSVFWEKQNQLLLTNEMLDFLKTVNDENNEYRAISNLN
ncbi:hypothetical protein [Joostella sp.]|uniref:hypothetical protein n=1 Tax=Joostella sp. TaxID=2231138 RepID=UPI003A903B28